MALTDNLLAYYKFDENAGTLVSDATGNGNTGNWGGGVGSQWTTGVINSGGSFTSAGGYAFVTAGVKNIPQGTNLRTLNYWLYAASFGGNDTNIAYGASSGSQAFGAQINGGTSIHFEGWFADADFAVTLGTATWYQISIVYNGGSVIGYLNGTVKGTLAVSLNTTGTILNFGTNITGNAPMNGRLDEVGIWSRALSSAELGTLYNSGAGLQYPFITNPIQSTGTAVLGLGSTITTWASSTTTGNLVVVGVALTNAAALGTVSSVTDTQSNTYTRAIRGTISSLGDILNVEIWYGTNITGGAGSVIVNHTVDNCSMFAREYTGYNTLDITNSASGSSTTPNSGTSSATTQGTELVIIATGDDKGTTQTWTTAGFYSHMAGTATTITGLSMEDNVVITTGVQTGTLTLGAAANWDSLLATFYNQVASTGLISGWKGLVGVGR